MEGLEGEREEGEGEEERCNFSELESRKRSEYLFTLSQRGEESMAKLKKLLGPDFQKLTGAYISNEPADQSAAQFTAKTPVDRRDVEVGTRVFLAAESRLSVMFSVCRLFY